MYKSMETQGLCPRMLRQLSGASARSLSIIFEEPWVSLPTVEMLHLLLKITQRTAQATADFNQTSNPVTLQSLGKKTMKQVLSHGISEHMKEK